MDEIGLVSSFEKSKYLAFAPRLHCVELGSHTNVFCVKEFKGSIRRIPQSYIS